MMPIPLHWFAFPVNAILVLTLIFVTYFICIIPQARPISQWLSSNTALISALILLLAGCLFIGLLPQQHSGCVVTWWSRFYHSWYMALSVTYLFVVLIARIIHLFQQKDGKKNIGKITLHIGLITVLVGSYYGVPDEQTYRIDLSNIAYNNRAIDTRTERQQVLPFMLKINKIDEEKYLSGKARRVTADLMIKGDTEQKIAIKAGQPFRHQRYAFHLNQYRHQGFIYACSLLIVKNPWRWWIYIGMVILLLGFLLEMKPKHYLTILALGSLAAIIFLIIKIINPELLHRELVPALQSQWHIPHIILYMMSFCLLTISFILYWIMMIKRKEKIMQFGDNMMQVGLFLFTTATLIGSIWAESAWGHFWTWDLKETWALITLLLYYIYLYYRKLEKRKDSISALLITLSFISLQMCWYGIKLLPAAGGSLHLY